MQRSIVYWIKAPYRANTPELAQDESPAAALSKMMRNLARQWQRKFDQASRPVATRFADESMSAADVSLRDGGGERRADQVHSVRASSGGPRAGHAVGDARARPERPVQGFGEALRRHQAARGADRPRPEQQGNRDHHAGAPAGSGHQAGQVDALAWREEATPVAR
ncbi:hypothetical protein G6F50_015012 [Rhizopus delemar]|uniref:Uncharacterized protein n=1 Tax=Rhizopus delemar TaxID=936053 RepID=A0A9P7C5U0_9FUNG|nr:hypothetical protein G6F50_015012 [Rhizopus delemar]